MLTSWNNLPMFLLSNGCVGLPSFQGPGNFVPSLLINGPRSSSKILGEISCEGLNMMAQLIALGYGPKQTVSQISSPFFQMKIFTGNQHSGSSKSREKMTPLGILQINAPGVVNFLWESRLREKTPSAHAPLYPFKSQCQ